MSHYIYDPAFAEERERLAGIERLWDPGTRAIIDRLGIVEGWSCLEVGAGGGSMVEWLCDRAGEQGKVLATDVDTRFLDAIERRNLEVRRHDILADEPFEPEFDLAYARLVVEHLGPEALRCIAAAVGPGGLILLEDYDWDSAAVHPPQESFERVTGAVLGLMAEAGFDPNFGRRLVAELEGAGFAGIDGEGRVRLIRGGTPETEFFRLSLLSLRDALVEAGALEAAELDDAVAQLDDPANTYLSPILVSAWGRKA